MRTELACSAARTCAAHDAALLGQQACAKVVKECCCAHGQHILGPITHAWSMRRAARARGSLVGTQGACVALRAHVALVGADAEEVGELEPRGDVTGAKLFVEYGRHLQERARNTWHVMVM